MDFRVGFGNDIHKLAESRELVIGGIKIPYHKGCVAHSDGDVLFHALCDALLGAIGEKDIGTHFPDTDPKYKNIDSSILLKQVNNLINEKEFIINNIDCTIILEKPKLSPYIDSIKNNIANILEIKTSQIAVKAKTNEGLGEIGENNAIAAYCIISICKS
ncbi:2-C-methyl-D-erythritol 2,4-cyclodiphosphate synthase [Bacteroidales bacterium OttesenSCG-928-K03]|nr:2-C-methyl-D-erythritol 2,4-cyclodiphosphate synthase [Bacteroidales bacterium OttesenSCG-928-K03]